MLLSFFGAKIQKHSIVSKEVFVSKQGRPPRESEKGAVRCGRRARVGVRSILKNKNEFTSLVLFPHFWTLGLEILKIYFSGSFCSFIGP